MVLDHYCQMDSVICFESRSATMADILSSRLSCGEFDETSFMVEMGSFHEGLQQENETALRNSVEFGGDECDGWLLADLPNSNSPDATNSEYCTGALDIGMFGRLSNNYSAESCSSDDDFQISAADSLIKECHSTGSLMPLPLSTNLRSESLPMSISNTGLLKLVAGQSFPTENMEMNENCDVISEHYPSYEQRWPERGTMEDIERNWQKRKAVGQDINGELHCLRKRLSTGERSGGIIAGEMAVNNSQNERPLYVGSSEPNSDGSPLRTAGPARNAKPKPRARRGSATDPQSVYARNRRERINERLRTLQNLVPNGTKVDISTMLEQAIQYVTFMELQIKLLRSDEHWMYTPIAFNGMEIAAFGGNNLN